jgi:hypothetical protein
MVLENKYINKKRKKMTNSPSYLWPGGLEAHSTLACSFLSLFALGRAELSSHFLSRASAWAGPEPQRPRFPLPCSLTQGPACQPYLSPPVRSRVGLQLGEIRLRPIFFELIRKSCFSIKMHKYPTLHLSILIFSIY